MKERNVGLSIVRLIAMTMIIVCHILQALNSTLCYYFNVGVYLFLFMSGFLYGNKEIENTVAFFKKQGLKLYVPYIITLIIIIAINLLSETPALITEITSSVLCLQWYKFSVPNCGHLWYVSCIMLCYVMIPLLQCFAKKLADLSNWKKWFTIFVVIFGFQLIYSFGAIVQEANKITCFAVAYLIAYWRLYECKILRWGVLCTALSVCLLLYFGMYVLEYKNLYTVPPIILNYYKVALGALFVLSFNCMHTSLNNSWTKFLAWSDKYSYGIYLCHHMFILGSLSVMYITPYYALNIVLAIGLAIISGFFVIQLSSRIILLISNKIKD